MGDLKTLHDINCRLYSIGDIVTYHHNYTVKVTVNFENVIRRHDYTLMLLRYYEHKYNTNELMLNMCDSFMYFKY